ncbi:ATPase YjeE, predicted to have essential role in cell wall biosynthesis [Thioalkalivibrio nitratireducens DSM 14787]|uniref:tRNA threonylcarbamoyladenosine biosynthesis protein TsaE n=1 Tax=Thioalkalivibrio nitratireducens (strain DSM 14787 / UNIQEM 213 / ALEN2) TaxID=1255043 RepID=L0DXW8_THIND|nr:tRNA (adenosine(37)-N6)-threonylcarbamoyltransferase complex ATPase subunit type 1 TsaE [Thioalkalivibrio nitratireducens]AGA34419.1 ATPase YjeE, predicted to have essential role in cell wall biosynthesis [Thioalkalivibrio nitratireducens DSM 14787]
MSDAGLFLPDADATERAGAALARCPALAQLRQIHLRGDLGAGKTTLVRGLLRALGHRGAVRSPTYTLLEPYEFAGLTVLHFDLYRVGDPEELEYLGVREQSDGRTLWLVEWPDHGAGWLPPPELVATLVQEGAGRRLLWSGPLAAAISSQMRDL